MSPRWLPLLAALAGCTATANAQVSVNSEATAPIDGNKYPDPVETAPADSVTIHCEPTAVGDVRHVRIESEASVYRQHTSVTVHSVFEYRREILAISKKEVTRVKIAFLAGQVTITQGKKGKPKVTEDSLTGRTFVIARTSGLQPVVTTDGGAPVSPWLAGKIAPSFRNLGTADDTCEYPTGPMKVGHPLPNQYGDAQHSDALLTVVKSEVQLHLAEIQHVGQPNAVAVFAIDGNSRLDLVSGLRVDVETTGKMSVRASDGRLLGWKTTGRIGVDPETGQGSGTMWTVGTVTDD